jgi:ABC-type Zn uptake system ZnuABC Zn-binding protein ZnuA
MNYYNAVLHNSIQYLVEYEQCILIVRDEVATSRPASSKQVQKNSSNMSEDGQPAVFCESSNQ